MTYFDIEELNKDNIKDLSKIGGAGQLTTSNWGGIVIATNSTGEAVFIQKQWGRGKKTNIKEKKLKNDGEGFYFKFEDSKYYLNEFIIINRGA